MSSKKGNKDTPSAAWAGLLGAAAAAAIGAGVAYGAKKLYDALSETSMEKNHCDDGSRSTVGKVVDADTWLTAAGEGKESETKSIPKRRQSTELPSMYPVALRDALSDTSGLSLYEKLDKYYKLYVDIDETTMHDAQRVVDDVVQDLQERLKTRYSALHVGKMTQVGSAGEDLSVIVPDGFDFTVSFDINPDDWELVGVRRVNRMFGAATDGCTGDVKPISTAATDLENVGADVRDEGDTPANDTSPGTEHAGDVSTVAHRADDAGAGAQDALTGFWLVKQKEPLHTFDRLMTGDCLSPSKMQDFLEEAIGEVMSRYRKYIVKVSAKKPSSSLSLTVEYPTGREVKELRISFTPALSLGATSGEEVALVGEPLPSAFQGIAHQETFWRQSFFAQEREQILRCATDQACSIKCLKIVRAIQVNSSQLRVLSSYELKTVLLHQLSNSEECDWLHDTLSERFIDLIVDLHSFLKAQCLPHFFLPGVNLLEKYDESSLNRLEGYLDRVIKKNDFHNLLKPH